jgi:hypothetical protein
MPVINTDPLVIKDAKYTIAGNDYEFSIESATVTASTSTSYVYGSAPAAVYPVTTTANRALVLVFMQDWDTEDSLSRTLENLEGEKIAVTIQPKAGGTGVTGTVIVTPGAFGGAVNAAAKSTVTLPFVGKPTYTLVTPGE